MVKAVDEAAQAVATRISASAASDIIEVILQSTDFEYDVSALLGMDAVINRAVADLHEVAVNEKFNPMFIPNQLSELDEMLELQMKNDAVRFTGMDGNPFTIKMTDVRRDDEMLIVGKAQYRPFDLPSYSDIVQAHEQTRFN